MKKKKKQKREGITTTPKSVLLHKHRTGNQNSKPSDLEFLHAADLIGRTCTKRNSWDDSNLTVWIVVEWHARIGSSWCDFAASQIWRDRAFEKLGGFLQREIRVWSVKGAEREINGFLKKKKRNAAASNRISWCDSSTDFWRSSRLKKQLPLSWRSNGSSNRSSNRLRGF